MSIKPFAVFAVFLTSASYASAPGAWAAFNAKVAKACNASSALTGARSGEIVAFDDTLGKVVTLVTGTDPKQRKNSKAARRLCVYDQRSGRTWISQAKGWTSPGR